MHDVRSWTQSKPMARDCWAKAVAPSACAHDRAGRWPTWDYDLKDQVYPFRSCWWPSQLFGMRSKAARAFACYIGHMDDSEFTTFFVLLVGRLLTSAGRPRTNLHAQREQVGQYEPLFI